MSQYDVIAGSLLGDGTIRRTRRVRKSNTYFDYCFIKNQAKKDCRGFDKRSYLEFHLNYLLDFQPSIGCVKKKDGQDQYELRTRKSDFFEKLESEWYVDRIKVLPTKMNLTPLAVCIWFMDDGINYPEKRQAEFCTQSFTFEENERLVAELSTFGISSKIQSFQGKYNIYIGPETYLQLINLIKPFCVWDCFHHKHDLSDYKPQVYARGEINGHAKLNQEMILEIKSLRQSGVSQTAIAKKFGVYQSCISRILNVKRWKHLQGGVNCPALN